ncbi:MAG TPA: Stp1/IreP family PP2C-type Ser/Thr phosphatase [Actinomycetota bacterium]
MGISIFAATHRGLVRDGNEDSCFVGVTVIAVADGLGGHQAGEIASATAIEPVAKLDGQPFPTPEAARDAVVAAIEQGNQAVIEKAVAHDEYWGMGTTLTAAIVGDGWLQLGHVGDSRAYLLRDAILRQLTNDHTIVAEAVRQGRLSPGEASHHPERSILTRAVGLDPNLRVEAPPAFELEPGDQVLLCSDGLTEPVDEDQIALLLATTSDGQAACDALIDTANEAGGPDNITVILLRVDDADRASATVR